MNPTKILTNAKILNPQGSAFLSGDLILSGGTIQQVVPGGSAGRPSGADVVDLHGKFVLPGFTDAHLHLRKTALNLSKVDCETPTKEQCIARVRARARETPRGEWILGHGWNHNNWKTGFGKADELDRAAPHHPVYLTAKSLHASWANSKAFQAAGLDADSADPAGGKFSRDHRGNLTGILFENAMKLIEKVLPDPDEQGSAEAIEQVQDYLWKLGLTSVHDFDRRRCLSALEILEAQGRLKLRVLKQIYHEDLEMVSSRGLRTGAGSAVLKIGGLKLFADGALGPQTAAMLEPYQGQPENLGMLLHDPRELEEICITAVESGFSLAVHAIGDRANRLVLDTLEAVRKHERSRGLPPGRHRIEHVQLLHGADLNRLSGLEVIASMQPIHAPSDRKVAERVWGERTRYAYAFNSLLKHHTRLAFGSDAPVENPNPFWGMHAAVTRRDRGAAADRKGWTPEEMITRQQALLAYTQGPAYAAGWENKAGRLQHGCWADLIVLDHNPLTCSIHQLGDLSPGATMINGEFVWGPH